MRLKQFFSYYKPHKRLFIIDFSSAVIVAILELAFPVAVQWFIDELLPSGEWNTIVTVSILLLAVFVLSTFLQFIVSYLGINWGSISKQTCGRNCSRMCSASRSAFLTTSKPGTS